MCVGSKVGVMTEQESAKRRSGFRAALSKEMLIAGVAVLGLAVYLVARFVFDKPEAWTNWPLWIVLALGGIPLTVDLVREILRGHFGSDVQAGISITTAVLLVHYLAGAIIVLMLSGGEALEAIAARRASSVLRALSERMPARVQRKQDGILVEI